MNSTSLETEIPCEWNINSHDSPLAPIIKKFRIILRSYLLFNLFFILLITTELAHLFIHLTLLIHSFTLAINIALVMATIFSYFSLRLYFHNKKIDQYTSLIQQFLEENRSQMSSQITPMERHLAMTQLCRKLANALHGMEYQVIKLPAFLDIFSPPVEKLNAWIYWNDVHLIKELLLQTSIEEQVQLVRIEPTNLEVHAELANAYVMLSGLYVDPTTIEGLEEVDRWIPPDKYNETLKQKFRATAEKAIEEFKILNHYAPDDPWVHTQLAYSYHDLQMPKEEIEAYETILKLRPHDPDTLSMLGRLYFEQGLNAKGLQIYEKLKKSHSKKAENLISYYGA